MNPSDDQPPNKCPSLKEGSCVPRLDNPAKCVNCGLIFPFELKIDGDDPVNHPPHYSGIPAQCSSCGEFIECIDVVRHLGFNLGNAIKYVWRADFKGKPIEDLEKAAWYLADEIKRRKGEEK